MKKNYLLSILLVTASCGKKEEENKKAALGLEGTWDLPCYADGDAYSKENLVITATAVTSTVNVFSEGNCTGDELLSGREESSYLVGVVASSPADATKIDLSNTKTFLTVKKSEYVDQFNSISIFGKTDWALNVEAEITGYSEDGTSAPASTKYDIFKVSDTELCFGSESTGTTSSDDQRPTALETGDKCYKRK